MRTVEIVYRYDGAGAQARSRPASSEAALLRLQDGNRAFSELLNRVKDGDGSVRHVIDVDARDLGLLATSGAPSQYPFAAVLGCSDARVPLELIFNEGPNDLFVIRAAGNGLGSDALGSLRYAVEHLGASLKLIVVLGHSGCGAVSAAVDVFLNPADYLSLARVHSLRGILDRLLVVVQASARKLTQAFGADVAQRAGYRAALIEAAIVTNAALTAHEIEQAIGGDAPGSVQTAYGVYLLESRNVWTPQQDQTGAAGLAAAPRDAADFDRLSDAVVQSPRIAALLG
ncbi:MAG TPA: carbonic anhydrase [Xanthobacteraceae bacterium]|jgi:carbonic anhydrase|nr:carbonic anhydrase [Xanthobacteraceae bacterium]